jgi:hypothetical protein
MTNDDLVDLALAVSIVGHGGNVPLMLPVPRPKARELGRQYRQPGQLDFVTSVWNMVETTSSTPAYAAGFSQQAAKPPDPTLACQLVNVDPAKQAVANLGYIFLPFQASDGLEQPSTRSSVGIWKRLLDSIRATFAAMTWRSKTETVHDFAPPPTPSTSEIAAPAPTSGPKSENIRSSAANLPEIIPGDRLAGSTGCGYEMQLVVRCVDGRLLDGQGLDRGICPYCCGSKA